MRRLFPIVLAMLVSTGNAGEVLDADVTHHAGMYRLSLDMRVNADAGAVRRIVTDHRNMTRISDVLIESTLLDADDAGMRRRLVARTCILFFCFRIIMVEDIEERQYGYTVITAIVPALSDFSSGRTEWRIVPDANGHTRISYRCELTPDFWIPPLIGPVLMKAKMLHEARETVNRIERLAAP